MVENLSAAEDALFDGDLEAVERHCRAALAEEMDNLEALRLLLLSQEQRGQWEEAADTAASWAAASGNSGASLLALVRCGHRCNALGIVDEALGRLVEAEDVDEMHFEEARALHADLLDSALSINTDKKAIGGWKWVQGAKGCSTIPPSLPDHPMEDETDGGDTIGWTPSRQKPLGITSALLLSDPSPPEGKEGLDDGEEEEEEEEDGREAWGVVIRDGGGGEGAEEEEKEGEEEEEEEEGEGGGSGGGEGGSGGGEDVDGESSSFSLPTPEGLKEQAKERPEVAALVLGITGEDDLEKVQEGQWEMLLGVMGSLLSDDVEGAEGGGEGSSGGGGEGFDGVEMSGMSQLQEREASVWGGYRVVMDGVREKDDTVICRGIARLRHELRRASQSPDPTHQALGFRAIGLLLAVAIVLAPSHSHIFAWQDVARDMHAVVPCYGRPQLATAQKAYSEHLEADDDDATRSGDGEDEGEVDATWKALWECLGLFASPALSPSPHTPAAPLPAPLLRRITLLTRQGEKGTK